MNHCYRLVWNELQRAYVVAPENARGKHKGSGRTAKSLTALFGTTLLASFTLGAALAAPTDGVVSSGSGHIATNGAVTTITQNSDKLSLNWGSFNIASNETVNFIQPGSNSIALNRIIGSGATEIYGKLNANGQVFLLNPNGVLFGAGASVNVGGLVATTLHLSDADFNAGNYRFTGNANHAGKITNRGSITAADGGYIALLGGQVSNQGTLAAKLGNVTLAAGSDMTLDFVGDGLLSVTVNQGTLNALAENKQLIQADGGHVLLTAKAADSLIQAVVNNEGVIEARTVANRNGTIMLMGDMQNGLTTVDGTLDASAQNGDGGFIETSAAKVRIADGAKVTTKATNGQTGTWLIDPNDFTIAASGGDMTGAAVSTAVQNNNFEIQSTSGTTNGNGDIHVNDAISWSSDNTLTLTAERNININQSITATGNAARLVLNYGGSDYYVKAPITFSGANASLAINGNSYTLIHSMADLIGINAGLNGKYALAQNFDAGGTIYSNALIGSFSNKFNGSFTGLGHTISNLTINSNGGYVSLFGYADSSSVIRDIGMLGGSVTGNNSVGGLVGWNDGSISNAYATGSVNGNTNVGGLVGNNYNGSISNAYATGSVNGTGNYIGGLVGWNNGNISNAYATDSVNGTGNFVGGLVGNNSGSISNAYATGSVNGNNSVGGLVGGNNGNISNSYWDQTSTGQGNAVGFENGSTTTTSAVNSFTAYSHAGYTNLGSWSETASGSGVWVAKDGSGNPQWVMIEGSTRPFLYSEYSTTVNNAHQLQLMALNLNASYTLSANIDAAETNGLNPSGMWTTTGFSPIGNNTHNFTGTFDGQNHTISNLFIDRPTTDEVGLFGYAHTGSVIRDIGLLGGSVTGKNSVGGLVGYNVGNIDNVSTTGHVKGTGSYVGGLAGYNGGTISNAFATGNVEGISYTGGLIGINQGTISDSYATGNVKGTIYVGGLTGRMLGNGSVDNSHYLLTDDRTIEATNGSVNMIGGVKEDSSTTGKTLTVKASGNIDLPSTIDLANNNLTLNAGSTGTVTAAGAINVGTFILQQGNWTQNSATLASFFARDFRLDGGSFLRVAGGNGSAANAYQIADIYGLQGIGSSVDLLSKSYVLNADIDASGTSNWNANGAGVYAGFNPIGNATDPFIGTFNGQNHTISNLFIDRSATDEVGLFGVADNGSVIRNIGLLGGSVIGRDYVGGLAGVNGGTISNAYATGNMKGKNTVGGLVGVNGGSISNAYALGNVIGNDAVGGLVGQNYHPNTISSISNAYAAGSVNGNDAVGGLVGDNGGMISNTYATGKVTANIESGGLAGCDCGSITNSFYATTDASGNAINSGLVWDTLGTAKTFAELTQLSTFASWNNDIDTQGGTGSVWRIYEGSSTPLLRNFLKTVTVTMDGTHNGAATGSNLPYTLSDTTATLSGQLNYNAVGNALVFSGLYSGQQGYDISYAPVSSTYHPAPVTPSGNTSSLPTYQAALNSALNNEEAVQIAEQKEVLTIVDGGMRLPAGLGH